MSHSLRLGCAVAIGLAVAAGSMNGVAGQSGGAATPREWRDYAGGPDSSRFVAATADQQVQRRAGSQVAWTYPDGDTDFNPLVARGVVYSRARGNALVALDAATGKELWVHDGIEGFALRGVNYWESADGTDRRLLYSARNMLRALDAQTGKPIASFGTDGVVDLREGLDRDPETVEQQSRLPGQGVREPPHPRLDDQSRVHVGPRRHPRRRRPHGRASCGRSARSRALVSSAPTRGRTHARDTRRRRQRLGRALRRRGPRHRLRADRQRQVQLLRRLPARRQPVLPTASLRSTRGRARGSGTSRPCTTTSGTWTTTPRRS